MTIDAIIDSINAQLALHGSHRLQVDETSGTPAKGTIKGSISGQVVRIEYTTTNLPQSVANEISVFGPSGAQVGRGNPEADLGVALMTYQWNNVLSDLGLR